MTNFNSTLLGLTLVTACSASPADAGLFDWFTGRPSYYASPAAVSYTSPSTSNGYSLCGPNGCVPNANGQWGTSLRPTAPYGYNVQTPTYNVQTPTYNVQPPTYNVQPPAYNVQVPNQCFPTSSTPTTSYYGSTYGNSYYGNPSYGNAYTAPCATGNCPTAPNANPYNAPVTTPVNGNPYYGAY